MTPFDSTLSTPSDIDLLTTFYKYVSYRSERLNKQLKLWSNNVVIGEDPRVHPLCMTLFGFHIAINKLHHLGKVTSSLWISIKMKELAALNVYGFWRGVIFLLCKFCKKLWSVWNFTLLENQQMSLPPFHRYWQKTSDFLGQRQRTLLLTTQQVPWASCLPQFPLLPKSHRDDWKGLKWTLHM